jgi:hypothetical protein
MMILQTKMGTILDRIKTMREIDDEGNQENGDKEEDPDTEDTDSIGDTDDAEDVINTNVDEGEG